MPPSNNNPAGSASDLLKMLDDFEKKMNEAKEGVSDLGGEFDDTMAGMTKSMKGFFGKYGKELKDIEKKSRGTFDNMEDYYDHVAKNMVKSFSKGLDKLTWEFEDFGKSVKDALSTPGKMVSGVLGAFKGMMKGLNSLGRTQMEMGKKSGEVWRMLGGGGLRAFSALGAGALGAGSLIAGVFDQAMDQATNLNKQLTRNGNSFADLTMSAGNLQASLKGVREAALSASHNLMWGTNAEEMTEILTSLNKAGHTYKEMTKDTTNIAQAMKDYQAAAKIALQYSRAFGMSASEIATHQADFMHELGLSQNQIKDGFESIFQASQQAGFGTSRFYSMVQQATSGISLYSVRLDQAAGLLLYLSKVMSPQQAGQFLQSLTKGFGDIDFKERLRKILITGTDKTKNILKKQSEDMAKSFTQGLTDKGKEGTVDTDKMKKMAKDEFGVEFGADAKTLSQQLGKLSEAQRRQLQTKVKELDPSGQITRQLSTLIDVSKGGYGNMADTMVGMGAMGPGGTLAMKLGATEKLVGPLSELAEKGPAALIAAAEVSGESPEQLKLLMDIDRDMRGSYEELQKQAKNNQDILKNTGKQVEISEDQKIAQVEAHGAYVNASGEIVRASIRQDATGKKFIDAASEEKIVDFTDYQVDRGNEFAVLGEAMSEQDAYNMAVAENTTTMKDVLEQTIAQLLEKMFGFLSGSMYSVFVSIYNTIAFVYNALVDIASSFGIDGMTKMENMEDPEKIKEFQNNLRNASKAAGEELRAANKAIMDEQKKINELEHKFKTSTSKDEKEKLLAELELSKKNKEGLEAQAALIGEKRDALSGATNQSELDAIQKASSEKGDSIAREKGAEISAAQTTVKGITEYGKDTFDKALSSVSSVFTGSGAFDKKAQAEAAMSNLSGSGDISSIISSNPNAIISSEYLKGVAGAGQLYSEEDLAAVLYAAGIKSDSDAQALNYKSLKDLIADERGKIEKDVISSATKGNAGVSGFDIGLEGIFGVENRLTASLGVQKRHGLSDLQSLVGATSVEDATKDYENIISAKKSLGSKNAHTKDSISRFNEKYGVSYEEFGAEMNKGEEGKLGSAMATPFNLMAEGIGMLSGGGKTSDSTELTADATEQNADISEESLGVQIESLDYLAELEKQNKDTFKFFKEKLPDNIAKSLGDILAVQDAQKILTELGVDPAKQQQYLDMVKKGGLQSLNKTIRSEDISGDETAKGKYKGLIRESGDDFLLRGNTLLKFNPGDTVMGFLDNGPLGKALGGGEPQSSVGSVSQQNYNTNTFNISGGDEERVYNIVKQVLKELKML